MAVATAPKLVKVGSHSVSLEYARSGEVSREECYPKLAATWRGEEIIVEMEANRYRFADGDWSEWRVFMRAPDVTDRARQALTEVCKPLVLEWLDSDAYNVSRARSFRWMIRNAIREERYSTDTSAELLVRYGNELTDNDRLQLANAIDHLGALLAALDFRDDA